MSPCHGPDEVEGTSKNLTPVHGIADPTDPQAVGDGSAKPPTGGVDISDDGDDLSDSERSRKKRR